MTIYPGCQNQLQTREHKEHAIPSLNAKVMY
jgi:hypothetical protein